MNYQGYASYNNKPPFYGNEDQAYYDRGQGIPVLNKNNMTIQDIYRTPFLFTQEHKKNYSNMADTALKGIQTQSELSKLFFSDENIRRIQKMIKMTVYNKSKGQFRLDADQDMQAVMIVMRAVYMEYGRFLPNHYVRQIKQLNQKVIDEIIPGILTEIRQEYGYLKEINKPISPIPRPINVNNAGRRALPSIATVFQ